VVVVVPEEDDSLVDPDPDSLPADPVSLPSVVELPGPDVEEEVPPSDGEHAARHRPRRPRRPG
jgi:hypothetical protein